KPVQPATADSDDDLAEVARLAGVTELVGVARYPRPMAPVAAADQVGATLPTRAEVLREIAGLDRPGRLTLVEGAGGLLVELAGDGVTLRDLAVDLAAPVLVVATAELGTLNHTALTLEGLAARRLSCAGVVIGSWPAHPDAVQTSNRDALARLAPLRAVLPAGAGALTAAQFAALSADAFDHSWVGALVS
ncbi:ATP-dependent dethiobiotin synthetase BioD, partial [Mycobacterium talmoniae]